VTASAREGTNGLRIKFNLLSFFRNLKLKNLEICGGIVKLGSHGKLEGLNGRG
jgi:hypothetical protein